MYLPILVTSGRSLNTHIILYFQRIGEEVANRDKKFAYLDEAGLYLIQKGDSADAIAVQAELDTFRQYRRQVMDRMVLTKVKLEAQEVNSFRHFHWTLFVIYIT